MNETEEKKRALKDIEKLDNVLAQFSNFGFDKKYPAVFEWVRNYSKDAKHYYEKGDYFSSFGCANYAYGFIDCVLIIEEKKREETKPACAIER